jgi:hypothetical protein
MVGDRKGVYVLIDPAVQSGTETEMETGTETGI